MENNGLNYNTNQNEKSVIPIQHISPLIYFIQNKFYFSTFFYGIAVSVLLEKAIDYGLTSCFVPYIFIRVIAYFVISSKENKKELEKQRIERIIKLIEKNDADADNVKELGIDYDKINHINTSSNSNKSTVLSGYIMYALAYFMIVLMFSDFLISKMFINLFTNVVMPYFGVIVVYYIFEIMFISVTRK